MDRVVTAVADDDGAADGIGGIAGDDQSAGSGGRGELQRVLVTAAGRSGDRDGHGGGGRGRRVIGDIGRRERRGQRVRATERRRQVAYGRSSSTPTANPRDVAP